MGQFFKQYPEPIKLDDMHFDWRAMDMNYLEEVKFSRCFSNLVAIAKPIHGSDAVFKAYNIGGDVRIQYNDRMDFERIAYKFGKFEKWKAIQFLKSFSVFIFFIFQGAFRIIPITKNCQF